MERTEAVEPFARAKSQVVSETATPRSTTRVSAALTIAREQRRKPLHPATRAPWCCVPATTRLWDGVADAVKATLLDLIVGRLEWPLLITGEVGSGKTCAGLCLFDYFGGWFTSLGELHERVLAIRDKRLFWTGVASCVVTLSEYWILWHDCNVCVLDELGVRSPTDAQYDTLMLAINGREEKPFVAISNLPPSELATVYDDRIASRLAAGTVLEMVGDKRLA